MVSKFIYDPATETQRLLGVYWSVAHDVYNEHGFMVLPYRVPGHPKCVYLPQMKGVNSKEIVNSISKFDRLNIPSSDPILNNLAVQLEKKLDVNELIDAKNTQEVEALWHKMEKTFEDYFLTIFPLYRTRKLKLNIYWTRFGSLVSYTRPIAQGVSNEATIFLRDDMGVSQIVEGALSSFLSQEFDRRQMSWLQYETVVDFLGLETCFSHLAPDYHSTVLIQNKRSKYDDGKLLSDSTKYLKGLGLERQDLISVRNGLVYIHGKPSNTQFGDAEMKFLEILVNKPMEPFSYYDLGDLIWLENEDSFSLWALSQLAYKVRNKLRKNNLNPDVIRNLRGVGYLFVPQN